MQAFRDFLYHFWGGIGDAIVDLRRGIRALFDHLTSYVNTWVDSLAGMGHHLFNALFNVYHFLRRWAVAVWHAIDKVWLYTAHHLLPFIRAQIRQAYNFVVRQASHLVHLFSGWLRDLHHWTDNAFRFLHDHVWAPMVNNFRALRHWIIHTLVRNVRAWIGDLGHWALRGFTYLWSHVFGVIHWLEVHIARWVPVLDRYASDVLRFLTDPGRYIMVWLETIAHRAGRWFVGVALRALADHGGFIEDWVGRFLSL